MADPQTTLHSRRMLRRSIFRRTMLVFGILFACIGTLYLFYFLSTIGPQPIDRVEARRANLDIPDTALELLNRSRDAEARFEELLTLRQPDDEHLSALREALRFQRAYMDALPRPMAEAIARYEMIELRYHTTAGEILFQQSVELENEAEKQIALRNPAEAAPLFEQAAVLQQRINNDFARSPQANRARETRLSRAARFAAARPLHEESIALEKEGEEAFTNEEWEAAEGAFRAALRIQDQINREFAGSPLASSARAEELRRRLTALLSGQDYQIVLATAKQAQERFDAGEHVEAAGLFQEARRLQIALNERFPGSPHASTDAVKDFERQQQTAQSHELATAIEQRHAQMNDLLLNRKVSQALDVLDELRAEMNVLANSFPLSTSNNPELQNKLRYLNLIQNTIAEIQKFVDDNLLSIPEVAAAQMLRTEVPQSLYQQVMAMNPSRNTGPTLPVESVSWNEAREFCQRLSWILAQPVRLPTEMEFRHALGPLRFLVIEDHAWSIDNSDRQPHPVANRKAHSSGFYDLLGNVAEWLTHEGDDSRPTNARNIGGNHMDRTNTLFTVPLRESPANERNRLIGFRFVVVTE
jgi:hypothetical protein